jgi:hypothetical protein
LHYFLTGWLGSAKGNFSFVGEDDVNYSSSQQDVGLQSLWNNQTRQ